MNADNIEQQRIADYARGWNTAATGQAPVTNSSLYYILGFMDATR